MNWHVTCHWRIGIQQWCISMIITESTQCRRRHFMGVDVERGVTAQVLGTVWRSVGTNKTISVGKCYICSFGFQVLWDIRLTLNIRCISLFKWFLFKLFKNGSNALSLIMAKVVFIVPFSLKASVVYLLVLIDWWTLKHICFGSFVAHIFCVPVNAVFECVDGWSIIIRVGRVCGPVQAEFFCAPSMTYKAGLTASCISGIVFSNVGARSVH